MQALVKLGVGHGLEHHVDAPFPKSYRQSTFGIKLNEDALQERYKTQHKHMHTYTYTGSV